MKPEIKFTSAIGFAISNDHLIIKNPTTEDIEKMEQESVPVRIDVSIPVPAALIVLLGIEPRTRVNVPSRSLTWALSARGVDANGWIVTHIDKGAIMYAWLDSGAPLKWDGARPTPEKIVENRQKLARDASGRFCRATKLIPSAANPWEKLVQG